MKSGDILTKQQIINDIIFKINAANHDDLCDIWEAAQGFNIDMRLKYHKDKDLFEVYEETNLN